MDISKLGTAKWKERGLPQKGWWIEFIDELEKGEWSTCDWCGTSIRFIYYIQHELVYGTHQCGCVCAGYLTDDYDQAKAMGREFRASKKQKRRDSLGKTREDWDAILKTCLAKVQGQALNFIKSLHSQWYFDGKLTVNQKEALLKFYSRIN